MTTFVKTNHPTGHKIIASTKTVYRNNFQILKDRVKSAIYPKHFILKENFRLHPVIISSDLEPENDSQFGTSILQSPRRTSRQSNSPRKGYFTAKRGPLSPKNVNSPLIASKLSKQVNSAPRVREKYANASTRTSILSSPKHTSLGRAIQCSPDSNVTLSSSSRVPHNSIIDLTSPERPPHQRTFLSPKSKSSIHKMKLKTPKQSPTKSPRRFGEFRGIQSPIRTPIKQAIKSPIRSPQHKFINNKIISPIKRLINHPPGKNEFCERPEIRYTYERKRLFPKYDYSFLPDEILLNIFSYLTGKELIKAGLVCKTWFRVSQDQILWKKLCVEKYHIDNDIDGFSVLLAKTTWKEQFVKARTPKPKTYVRTKKRVSKIPYKKKL